MERRLEPIGFRLAFGYTPPELEALFQLVGPSLAKDSDRGNPIPPLLKLQAGILVLRGNMFLSFAGKHCGISPTGAHIAMHELVEAVCALKPQLMRLPTNGECELLATQNLRQCNLPNIVLGVDGKAFRLHGKPKFRPPSGPREPTAQDYYHRKVGYALNAQLVGDGKFFRDAVVHYHGRAHDARIFAETAFAAKWAAPRFRPYLVVADSAYPISKSVMIPFSS